MNTATMALLVILFVFLLTVLAVGCIVVFVNLSFSDNKAIAWSSRIVGVVLLFGFMYGTIYLKLM